MRWWFGSPAYARRLGQELKTEFAADSALEGTGFEPSVPPDR
jgi:hypothetical protein